PIPFGEPDVTVRTCGNSIRVTVCHWERKLSNHSSERDSSNLVAQILCEPEVSVGSSCNPLCPIRIRRYGLREFGEWSARLRSRECFVVLDNDKSCRADSTQRGIRRIV